MRAMSPAHPTLPYFYIVIVSDKGQVLGRSGGKPATNRLSYVIGFKYSVTVR
jgi:hypothetical protein